MHGGLSPFNTLVWPVSERMRQLVTRHRARKDVEHVAAAPLVPPLRWRGASAAAAPLALLPEVPGGALAYAGARSARSDTGGLRLGFISSDLGDHPVGHALLPWFQALGRSPRLHLCAFASDSSERRHAGSALRRALAEETRGFFDISELSDAEALTLTLALALTLTLTLALTLTPTLTLTPPLTRPRASSTTNACTCSSTSSATPRARGTP